jgi:hypothetical protein
MPGEHEAVIVAIRQGSPWLGARAIRTLLVDAFGEHVPAVSTIARVLRRNGLGDRVQFTSPDPNTEP